MAGLYDSSIQKLIQLLIESFLATIQAEGGICYLNEKEEKELDEWLWHFYDEGDFNEETNKMLKEYFDI